MKLVSSRPFVWFLSLVMFITPLAPSINACAAEAELERQQTEQRKQLANKVERGFELLEKTAQDIPRDSFDVDSIIAEVGSEPEKLFAWVRDNTYWVPYNGSLRGPVGVLMDRLGNSLDRSLLLAELLRRSGHECRLARAPLSEGQGYELLAKLSPVPSEPSPIALVKPGSDTQDLEQLAIEHGLDPAEMVEQIQAMTVQASRFAEDLNHRVAEQTPRLLEMLNERTNEEVAAQRQEDSLNRLTQICDHWWLQYSDGDTWTDLDTLLPTAAVGAVLAEPVETFASTEEENSVRLAGDYCHEVAIRVVIERLQNGKLDQQSVLERTLRPSELFGQPITISHHAVDRPQDLDSDKPVKALKDAVLKQKEWIPLLRIGDKFHYDKSFTSAGDVFPATIRQGVLSIAGKSAEGFGRAGGLLGGLFGRRGKRKQNQLTAQWIEYEIRAPGQEPRTIRREIFDVIGPAARAAEKTGKINAQAAQRVRAAALAGQTQILPVACDLSPTFVGSLIVDNLLSNRDVVLSLLRLEDEQDRKAATRLAQKARLFPGVLYQFVAGRLRVGTFARQAYIGQLNIVSHHDHLRINVAGQLFKRAEFDIVCNEVSVHARDGLDAFHVRLTQGVVDTNLEALMGWPQRVRNVGTAFTSGEWDYVATAQQLDGKKLHLSDDMMARLHQDLRDGHSTVVGEHNTGWWRIDPVNGDVLGIGPNGHGQAAPEWLIVIGENVAVGMATGLGAGIVGCFPHATKPGFAYGKCLGFSVLAGAVAGFFVGLALVAPFTGEAASAGMGWLGVAGGLGGAVGGVPGFFDYD